MRRILPSRIGCVVLAAAIVASGGCGIAPDSSPRDVAPAERNLTVNAVSDGDEAGGTSRIYLVAPSEAGDPSLLRSTSRDVASGATPLIKSLLAGPNDEELSSRLVTNIPQETVLISARSSGDVLFVDVSPEITELSGDLLVLAVAQIVFTATEIEGVRAVRLRVNGQDQRWPKGDGETREGALTVYDFPGLVQSAQPAYPAVPSPG
ncbi:MAG TPA: GerMN domain-containing protein [Ilumatobacteraceae bacterium]|nr:GerMN domain-containing protein [Ilumatobacteraceae bacterium]